MFVTPVVVHLSRLVDDIGDPPKEEDFLGEAESNNPSAGEEDDPKVYRKIALCVNIN